jgi:hypothetical protein
LPRISPSECPLSEASAMVRAIWVKTLGSMRAR